MAKEYYGVAVGGKMKTDVTKDTATTGAAIELSVDLTATGVDKQAVLLALEGIEQKILEDTWPPA
jgi:hypothetical protein